MVGRGEKSVLFSTWNTIQFDIRKELGQRGGKWKTFKYSLFPGPGALWLLDTFRDNYLSVGQCLRAAFSRFRQTWFPSLRSSLWLQPNFSTVRADVEWPPAAGRVGCSGGGWEAGWSSSSAGVSQPQLGSPPKKKKTFHSWHRPELPCETHFLPWQEAGSSSVQGNPENQLRARRGGREGASAASRWPGATRAPRTPDGDSTQPAGPPTPPGR